MSTDTLPATKTIVSFSNDVLEKMYASEAPVKRFFERGGRKVLSMENVAVFRSGTFRDSIGRQATYEPADIQAFVSNFNNLKATGVFPNVPVRKGHPQFGVSSMDTLIGHLVNLRAEEKQSSISKQTFTVLFADYEILDPNAQEAIDSGLWLDRSSEVGVYTDNNDVDHAPVFMGFAYVDIPAVERLNEFSKNGVGPDRLAFSYITEEIEMSASTVQVATPPAPTAPAQAPAPVPAAPVEFSIGGAATTDYAAVQNYITALEKKNADYAAAEATRIEKEREDFVKGLATGDAPKLAATQIDVTMAFAKGLSAEQFSAWKSTMETVAPNPLFQQHGASAGATSVAPESGEKSPEDAAFETAKAIVTNLAKAGVPEAKIKAGESYAKVIAKDPSFTIPSTVAVAVNK